MVGPLRRWRNVRSACNILYYHDLACGDHRCYLLASITHTRGVCAACGMEFLLPKLSTRISFQLVRLFSLLVSRILRLFVVQATVSCKCFSEVAKKGRPKERRRRCVCQGHQQRSVSGPRLGALPYTPGASEVPRLIQAALCYSTADHCCTITDGAILFHAVVQTLGAPLPLFDLHGGLYTQLNGSLAL
jgi:hypothetical protein